MNVMLTDHRQISEPESISAILRLDFSVYEVFRVIGGIPLFLEDHFKRLQNSLRIQEIASPLNYAEFQRNTLNLISASAKSEGNIRFVILAEGKGISWYFTFVPAVYPDGDDFQNGVKTELFEAERANPNAKVFQKSVRITANQLIAERRIYEVLLTDRDGFITEGSRSNVFFVKDDAFFTAHESRVLVGVTRQKVIGCMLGLGYKVIEKTVHKSELPGFDAVFLTGTSPKVLPVKSIGNLQFKTENEGMNLVMRKYDEMIDAYLENQRKNVNH